MAKKPTIDDIANLAGVSKATVSRVLNHKPDVNPETRERVLRVMEEEGFVPSITATGLAGGQSRLIGVLVPSFTWPFVGDVLRGVAEVVAKTHYELVLYSINDRLRDDDKSDTIDHILATKLVSGLLAIFPGPSTQHVARLYKNGFPTVLIDDRESPPSVPWVGADNFTGAYSAVRHLLSLGHRRIAHIHGPTPHLGAHERYQGYCRALEEAGIEVDPGLVYAGNFAESGGHAAARTFLVLPLEQRPTAIFAANDQTAIGFLSTAEEFGLVVPRDVALVGFDDITAATLVRPALTTVRQPFAEMGQRGIDLLLSMLNAWRFPGMLSLVPGEAAQGWADGARELQPIRIQLETNLVVRASCGTQSPMTSSISGLSL